MKSLFLWNIAVLALYGFDKYQAKRHRRRISEKVLMLSTILLGGVGALLGMIIFHHKTKKLRFILASSISTIITVIFAVLPYIV